MNDDRTHQQRLDALQRANDMRVWGARLKRWLKARDRETGRFTVAILLDDPTLIDELGSVDVRDLIQAIPGYGPLRAKASLDHARITSVKPHIRDLERYQLDRLAAAIRNPRITCPNSDWPIILSPGLPMPEHVEAIAA